MLYDKNIDICFSKVAMLQHWTLCATLSKHTQTLQYIILVSYDC